MVKCNSGHALTYLLVQISLGAINFIAIFFFKSKEVKENKIRKFQMLVLKTVANLWVSKYLYLAVF
jgi:hypothetical protein